MSSLPSGRSEMADSFFRGGGVVASAAGRAGARSNKTGRMVRKGQRRDDSVGCVVNGDELDKDVFDEFERDLVRSVGEGLGGI